MTTFAFQTTPQIEFGAGCSGRLGELARSRALQHVLLVTDAGLVNAGLVAPAEGALEAAGVAVTRYDAVSADPPEAVVMEAAAIARDQGVDGVIGLGGGSSMDVAKLVAVLAHGEQPLSEMYGVDQVRGGRLPLIQVPTTAGTGSEVTAVSIVTTGATTKMGVVAPQLFADLAVLDPALTLGLPPAATASTGIDAMVHAIEAYTSRHRKNPCSDMLARQALTLMSRSLRQAVHQGDDMAARGDMLLGAMLAGQAFANAPVAAVHALAYPLGGHYHVPHGLSNALVLLPVLQFNAPAAAALYAELLPCMDPQEPGRMLDATAGCDAFMQALDKLIEDVALPRTLRTQGVTEDALPMLAAEAMKQQRLLINNPREVGEADALAIYRSVH